MPSIRVFVFLFLILLALAPRQTIAWEKETGRIPLTTAESVVLPSSTPDIRDIKTHVRPEETNFPVFIVALVLPGLFFFFVWLRRRAGRTGVAPPAHEAALAALERLKSSQYFAQGRTREFYVELCGIVRTYLESRLPLSPLRMTKEEILLRAAEERSLWEPFFTACDRAKFALHQPSAEEMQGSLGEAERIIVEGRNTMGIAQEARQERNIPGQHAAAPREEIHPRPPLPPRGQG